MSRADTVPSLNEIRRRIQENRQLLTTLEANNSTSTLSELEKAHIRSMSEAEQLELAMKSSHEQMQRNDQIIALQNDICTLQARETAALDAAYCQLTKTLEARKQAALSITIEEFRDFWEVHDVRGDGNCLFRALCMVWQYRRCDPNHKLKEEEDAVLTRMRKRAVEWVGANREHEIIQNAVLTIDDFNVDKFCTWLGKSGSWDGAYGDLVIHILARALNRRICVVENVQGTISILKLNYQDPDPEVSFILRKASHYQALIRVI